MKSQCAQSVIDHSNRWQEGNRGGVIAEHLGFYGAIMFSILINCAPVSRQHYRVIHAKKMAPNVMDWGGAYVLHET